MDMSELLSLTTEKKASDLHLTVGLPPMLRIDGEIQKTEFEVLDRKGAHELIYSILTDEQKAKYESFHEIDFSISVGGVGRFRGNVFRQKEGDAAVFRLIPSEIKSFEELHLPDAVARMADETRGLILVTGHTGSGKSTTLAALLKRINESRRAHIITIEDPIEFVHPHIHSIVNQREVGAHTPSFSSALRNALREDPDVILVGEMRDLETIQMAITAAETGHLILATVHTNSCASTVDRIVDVFPSHQQKQVRMQFASSMRGVISQQLIPRAEGQGRVCAIEMMVGTPAIASLIREGKTHQILSAIQTGTRDGMMTMDQCLKGLMSRQLITPDVALRYAHNPEVLGMQSSSPSTPSQPSSSGGGPDLSGPASSFQKYAK